MKTKGKNEREENNMGDFTQSYVTQSMIIIGLSIISYSMKLGKNTD